MVNFAKHSCGKHIYYPDGRILGVAHCWGRDGMCVGLPEYVGDVVDGMRATHILLPESRYDEFEWRDNPATSRQSDYFLGARK